MVFRMDQFLTSLSEGLDEVEGALLGATTHHGRRIAILTIRMGQHLGWTEDALIGVGVSALLHDNALTEYILSESPGKLRALNLKTHCIKGEENASHLPFPSSVKGYILYHHEFMDRSGGFGMNPEETPMGAQLIAIADSLDIRNDLRTQDELSMARLRADIESKRGTYYTAGATDALLAVLDGELLLQLRDESVDAVFGSLMPKWTVDMPARQLMDIAQTVAQITDYKSEFTAKHSIQIANRAYLMARYYQMDEEVCAKIYIAASLHDIGKLRIPTDILEKPGKLTREEYEIIKSHVYWSYMMLKDVDGFDEICRWAVTHHRKLDGLGYPDLPEAYSPLDFLSRMMACIDIYQAVREKRPYHDGRTHRETMDIMWDMANKGEIDAQITKDIDEEMARFKGDDGDVPSPWQIDALLS